MARRLSLWIPDDMMWIFGALDSLVVESESMGVPASKGLIAREILAHGLKEYNEDHDSSSQPGSVDHPHGAEASGGQEGDGTPKQLELRTDAAGGERTEEGAAGGELDGFETRQGDIDR